LNSEPGTWLGRHSTTWNVPLVFFALIFLRQGLTFWSWSAWFMILLFLLLIHVHRCEPLCLAQNKYFWGCIYNSVVELVISMCKAWFNLWYHPEKMYFWRREFFSSVIGVVGDWRNVWSSSRTWYLAFPLEWWLCKALYQ
jgi:hypothetical protein